MAEKRAQTLLALMVFIERFTLTRAWDGLTDDELLWEPMPGCWSVRPVDQIETPNPFVVGDWAADMDAGLVWRAVEGQAIEPLTTIGWLCWHMGSMPGRTAELDFLGGDHTTESGWTSPYLGNHPIFRTADDAVATIRAGWQAVGAALGSATDEQLEAEVRYPGYDGNPGPTLTGTQVVAGMLNEVSHHGTQIGVLRDLYRLRGTP